jgi:hypothetical protein
MEEIGSMEPEALLQLLTGSAGCAVVIFLFILVYFFASRRSKGRNDRGASGGGRNQWAPPPGREAPPAPGLRTSRRISAGTEAELAGPGVESLPVDVGARLAGTGREAWLVDTPAPVGSAAGEPPAAHAAREVLRLVRSAVTGQMWVQVAGMRYRSLTDIRDRALGERVLSAITCALRFSSGRAASDRGIVTLQLPACDAVGLPTPFGALSTMEDTGEVLRLMSDPDRGLFCVHVAGHCYRRLLDVGDRRIGQCILESITRLLQFSNGMLATNDGAGLVPIPPLSPAVHTPLPEPPPPEPEPGNPSAVSLGAGERPAVQPASVDPSPQEEQERFLRQLMDQAQPQIQPVERPTLMSSIRRVRSKPPSADLPSLNLADEIDRIFQSKLSTSPLADTDARVESNADGGVRIRIGLAYYDTPDDVPDAQLRHLLKLSIAEWERS